MNQNHAGRFPWVAVHWSGRARAPDRWFEIKSQVHHKLLNSLTPDQLKDLNKESVRGQIGAVVEKLILDESLPMTLAERERLIEEILDEVFGLGRWSRC